MEKNTLIPSPSFEFSTLSMDELNSLDLTDGFYSPFNIKCVFSNEIVGYIIVEALNPHFQANEPLDEGLLSHLNLLNSKRWFLIRKIYFKEKYRDTGNLENMFDKLVCKLPDDCDLWCNVSIATSILSKLVALRMCQSQFVRIQVLESSMCIKEGMNNKRKRTRIRCVSFI